MFLSCSVFFAVYLVSCLMLVCLVFCPIAFSFLFFLSIFLCQCVCLENCQPVQIDPEAACLSACTSAAPCGVSAVQSPTQFWAEERSREREWGKKGAKKGGVYSHWTMQNVSGTFIKILCNFVQLLGSSVLHHLLILELTGHISVVSWTRWFCILMF